MDDLLKLLQLLCVAPNHLPKSVYLLKKHFKKELNTTTKKFAQTVMAMKRTAYVKFQCLLAIPIEKPIEAIVNSK